MLFGLAALSTALLREPQKSPDDAAIIPLKGELKSYRELQDFYDKSFQSTNLPILSPPPCCWAVTRAAPILLGQKFSSLVQYGLLQLRVALWWNDSPALLRAFMKNHSPGGRLGSSWLVCFEGTSCLSPSFYRPWHCSQAASKNKPLGIYFSLALSAWWWRRSVFL